MTSNFEHIKSNNGTFWHGQSVNYYDKRGNLVPEKSKQQNVLLWTTNDKLAKEHNFDSETHKTFKSSIVMHESDQSDYSDHPDSIDSHPNLDNSTVLEKTNENQTHGSENSKPESPEKDVHQFIKDTFGGTPAAQLVLYPPGYKKPKHRGPRKPKPQSKELTDDEKRVIAESFLPDHLKKPQQKHKKTPQKISKNNSKKKKRSTKKKNKHK